MLAALPALAIATHAVRAQDRLVGARALAVGTTVEALAFGGGGVLQPAALGIDSARIRGVRQWSVPVSVAVPIGTRWTVDVTALYVRAEVRSDAGARGTGGVRTDLLEGASDVRVRATGRVLGEGVLLTLGANLPTGRDALAGAQLAALRVTASPALALVAPPVTTGAGVTLGLLATRQWRGWTWVAGASGELRGRTQPVAQLAAGSGALDYRPGPAVRLSAGGDGLLGPHRLAVTATAELFGEDALEGSAATLRRTVRLGPIVGGDAQLALAVPRARDVTLWTSVRHRTPFARDGARVAGTAATYLDGGVRTAWPLRPRLDLVLAGDARWHSGLDAAQGLPTAGVVAGGALVGVAVRRGRVDWQPWLRAQLGRVRTADAALPGARATLAGASAGLTLLTRF